MVVSTVNLLVVVDNVVGLQIVAGLLIVAVSPVKLLVVVLAVIALLIVRLLWVFHQVILVLVLNLVV